MTPHTQGTQHLLKKLSIGKSLSTQEATKLFKLVFVGKLSLEDTKAFLLLLSKKGENADELTGCLKALQSVETPKNLKIPSLMDTCGTGGDGHQSLNISTLAALVIAGAGGKVAKHGNRAISSKCGSSDLMEALGIKLHTSPKKMIHAIHQCGIGYFHAPFYHPAFAKLQPLRQALRRRTILNLLGPLVNPFCLQYQLVGVANKRIHQLYSRVLSKLKRKGALVCHSLDGLDEVSTSAPTLTSHVTPGKIRYALIHPRRLGVKKAPLKKLRVTSLKQSKHLALKILKATECGPARDVVVLNAACGLWTSKKAGNLKKAIQMAGKALDSGKAYEALQKLKRISNSK